MRPSSTAVWLLLALAACSPEAPPDPLLAPGTGRAGTPRRVTIPQPPPLRSPPPPPGDMPDPDTCTVDADCRVVVAGADPAHPCCDRVFPMRPTAVSYLNWAESYQLENCGDVHCDPLPYPGVPATECALQARCKEGRCANACDEGAAPAGPERSRHDPSEARPRPGTAVGVSAAHS